MKKRKFISIALTILVIVVTFNYWFISRPLTFSMDIKSQSENPIIITTVLNRKDDPSFSKSYENGNEINLQKTNKYNISFRQKTPPKRLRLILNQIEPKVEYQISNLSFRNGKYPVSDLSKFKSDNAKLKINDNSLVIISNSDTATLDYPERITAKQSKKFDLKIFLIISILSFLLFLKLTSYLADFKINKNVSRLDIIFLATCATLLFIPMFNINQDVKSEQENRNLAKWKPLFNKDNSINLNFGKDYESWISDRFYGKKILLPFYAIITGDFFNGRAIEGEDLWLFYLGNNSLNNYLGNSTIKENDLKNLTDNLASLDNYCKTNNKKFLFFVAPDKNSIYGEFFNVRYKINNPKKNKRIAEQAVDYIKAHSQIEVIYPQDEMIKYKQEHPEQFLYFKQDTHWTQLGAKIAFLEIMKHLKIKSKHNFKYEKRISQGDLYKMYLIKLKSKHDETLYDFLTDENLKSDYLNNNLKLVIYGDSFTTALLPYLNTEFKYTRIIRSNSNKKINYKDIEDADIIIVETVERYLPQLSKIWWED